MTTAIEKPDPPADSECCESGCTPCVWDTYYEELRVWREQQAASSNPPPSKQGTSDKAGS